jgi:hypothetical protein
MVWGKMCYKGIVKAYTWLVSQYNASPTTMGRIPPKGLIMVKMQALPRTCAIWGGMTLCNMKTKLKQLKKSTR